MPRKTYIHRDTMLKRLAEMPDRRESESDEQFQHRVAVRASAVARHYGLTAYSGRGRAHHYDEARVDAIAAEAVKPIPAKAA